MEARDLVRQSRGWGGGGCQLDIMKLIVIIMTIIIKTVMGEGVDVAGYHEDDTDNNDPHDEDGDWGGGECEQGGKLLKNLN